MLKIFQTGPIQDGGGPIEPKDRLMMRSRVSTRFRVQTAAFGAGLCLVFLSGGGCGGGDESSTSKDDAIPSMDTTGTSPEVRPTPSTLRELKEHGGGPTQHPESQDEDAGAARGTKVTATAKALGKDVRVKYHVEYQSGARPVGLRFLVERVGKYRGGILSFVRLDKGPEQDGQKDIILPPGEGLVRVRIFPYNRSNESVGFGRTYFRTGKIEAMVP